MALLPSPRPSERSSVSPNRRRLGDTQFRYSPIDLKKNGMRLLRLLPGSPRSMVNCELFHVPLDAPRKYSALSYAWGITENTRLIRLDGHTFPVTENLLFALERLRLEDRSVILWVDAICIDQKNVKERNHQVQEMRHIYRKAQRVVMWLGPEAANSKLAIDVVWEIYHNPDRLNDIVANVRFRPHFTALVHLFERDYWQRIWVVQEVFNAQKIAVYCGPDAIPWSMLTVVSRLFQASRKVIIHKFNDFITKGNGWDDILLSGGPTSLTGVTRSNRESDMLDVLLFHRRKLCVESKDKVYGILGVLRSQERREFKVDYSLSTRQTYINVAHYILRVSRSLDVICASFPRDPNIHQLPSWVPDWEQRVSTEPMCRTTIDVSDRFYAAGDTRAEFSLSESGDHLEISAVFIGTLLDLGSPLSEVTALDTIILTFHHWRSALLRSKKHISEEDHEAFCRTLCCGSMDRNKSPQDLMRLSYGTFASLTRETNPSYIMDHQLTAFADAFHPSMIPERKEFLSDHIIPAIQGRRYFLSDNGLMGIGPYDCVPGDIICVPLGCSTPVILRREGRFHVYIGDAYVNTYMYGKAVNQLNDGKRALEIFEIH